MMLLWGLLGPRTGGKRKNGTFSMLRQWETPENHTFMARLKIRPFIHEIIQHLLKEYALAQLTEG